MKLSELKEQIKELHSLQEETEVTVKNTDDAKKIAEKVPNAKIKVAEFKEFLRQEILAEITEQEDEEEVSDDADTETPDGEAEIEAEPFTPEPTLDKRDILDDIGDELVVLAKKAKKTGEEELANQILNSAKFTEKKEFQAVSKDVGVQDRGEL